MKLSRAVVLSGIAAALVAHGAAAAPVQWYRFDPSCGVVADHLLPPLGQPEVTELRCGGYGRFFFGAPGLGYGGRCTFKSSSEEPPLYPVEPVEDRPGLPCPNGSCLGHLPAPWIAAIDWNAPHGWTVAETLLQAADRRVAVELFDLSDTQGRLPSWLLEVGDAHVLVQVCAVAERVANNAAAPLAINMSFGRLATPGSHCSTGAARLECEIEGALSHLRGFGTVPVAAAGNSGKLLFPAASAQVLAAGAMDLAWYRQTGNVRPSSETPAGAEVLVPGYGLYLATEQQGMGFWAAPAGTSYASALAAGWIAGARASFPNLPPPVIGPPGVWTPVRCGVRYCLARNGQLLPGSSSLANPTALLLRASGQQPAACDVVPPLPYTVVVQGPAAGLPERTLPDLIRELNCSQPGAHPCVPCHGGENGFMGAEIETDEILVDLELSEGLPENFELNGLYLQVGGTVYSLDRSQDPVLRDALEDGILPGLRILGLASVMQPGEQLSLVYVLRTRGLDFRESTPIHVHVH